MFVWVKDIFNPKYAQGIADTAMATSIIAAVALIPPLVMLVLGLLGVWVVSGFRAPR